MITIMGEKWVNEYTFNIFLLVEVKHCYMLEITETD